MDGVRTGTHIAGDFARPFGIYFLSICLGGALFLLRGAELVAGMGLVGTALGSFVVVRGMDNRAEAKVAAEVKIAESKATGKPSVGALSDAAVVAASPPIAEQP
jgi:hypothetical protein